MITSVILPQLGDTMNEGTLLRWYKREGESVQKGEPLFEVLTDKANMEVEATASGYLRGIRRWENETVPIGEVIAYVTTTLDEPIEPSGQPAPVQPQHKTPATIEAIAPQPAERVKRSISPRARRAAQERGVDLDQVTASSRSGRVVEADVLKFLEQREQVRVPEFAPAPIPTVAEKKKEHKPAQIAPAEQVVPIAGVRKVIAERMAASSRQVARVTLTTEADATRLVELRSEVNARLVETKFSYTEYIVLFVARALLKFPYMNRTLHEDGIHEHASVHMGIAVDTDRGLLVPVIRDADKKGVAELSQIMRKLSEEARTSKISADDLRGSTFTITNLGQYEVDAFTPIVNLPETAILGVGRIVEKPAAYQGQLALRHMVALSLAFDHRVVDGAPAARFLQEIKHLVETPGLVLV